MYSEKLKEKIEQYEKSIPHLKNFVNNMRKIQTKSSMDFDYEDERTIELYEETIIFLKLLFFK